MHRHGYKGKKFNRERDQRQALIKGLADSLVKYEKIETTLPKAKEVVPYVEKLITKAKRGDLHNRRQVISSLQTVASAHKLVDEIAPRLGGRSSGHLRVTKTDLRRGDSAQMAVVSFVDNLSKPTSVAASTNSSETTGDAAEPPKAAAKPAVTAKPTVKPSAKPKPAVAKNPEAKK